MSNVEIIEQGVVAARSGQMYGWPGIARAANGDIVVSASERKFHCCPNGREVIVRSRDNGKTWDLPQEVYNSELDDRDANVITLQDGTLVLSWFTSTAFEYAWKERAARVTEKMRDELIGTWMLKSHDHGHNWDAKPLRIPVGMHISPTQLSDGSLLSIGWEGRILEQAQALSCYRSDDLGETWTKNFTFDCPMKDGRPILNENHVLEVAPGKLSAMFRKCGDCLYQAFSDDYGRTWTVPKQTEIWGFPPHMIKLGDGRIVCLVGHRRAPYSIRGVVSSDNGKTWDIDNTFTVHQWEDEPDMGYPVSLEVAPNEILTVFYCSRRDAKEWRHVKQDGSTPEGILSVRYRLC